MVAYARSAILSAALTNLSDFATHVSANGKVRSPFSIKHTTHLAAVTYVSELRVRTPNLPNLGHYGPCIHSTPVQTIIQ